MTIALTDTTFDVLPYNSGVSRLHSYTINDALVVTWLASNGPPTYSENVVFTVVSLDGEILVPETRIEFPDTYAPLGFGDHVTHVSPDGNGGYIFYMTHVIYGYVDNGVYIPNNNQRLVVNIDASGSLVSREPLDPNIFLPRWEDSSTVELSEGGFAIRSVAGIIVVDADGNLVGSSAVQGTYGNGGPFIGATSGLDIVEVGGRLLTMHIDSGTNEVFGQFFTLEGVSDSAEFQISVGDHTAGSMAAVFEDGLLEATLLTDGRVAITYANGLNGQINVFATVLNADGSVSIPEFQVNTGDLDAGEQYHANVHALENGGFAITWNQNFVFSAVPGGFIQEYSANGTPVGAAIGVGIGTGSGVGYGSIRPDGSGIVMDWYGDVTVLEGGSGGGGGGSNVITIQGTDRNDTLTGTAGDDIFQGGAGFDVAVLAAALSDFISALQNLDGSITIETLQGFDIAFDVELFDFLGTLVTAQALLNGYSTVASELNDLLLGTALADRLDGGPGDDTINGGDGNDGLKGGDGNDLISGGPGNDRLPGETGNDTILGGSGNDRLGGGDGDDYMDGGDGNDRGGAGAGDDTILGGIGNDVFNGGQGNDYIDMGAGDDRAGGSFTNDTIYGGAGNDTLGGGEGNDYIDGGSGDDDIGAGGFNDTVLGGSGNDFIGGGDGDDSLLGGVGNDTINSGYGNDTVTGGAGADEFVFNALSGGGITVITDFEDGIDTIRVTGLRNPADPLARLAITDITYDGQQAVTMDYGDHTIVVLGVTEADLTTDDFLFV